MDPSLLKKWNQAPAEFKAEYEKQLRILEEGSPLQVFREPRYDAGAHPVSYMDYECAFAAHHLSRLAPKKILDIASYRHFVLGLLAHYQVTSLDVRERKVMVPSRETILVCDAKKLDLPDNHFDVVVSLCALEHFGLGRYGDEFDLDADQKAVAEIIRVLKPGGRLIVTTTITRAQPAIAFNAHRLYDYGMIQAFFAGLICEEERFYDHKVGGFCSLEEITETPNVWGVYLGCWMK